MAEEVDLPGPDGKTLKFWLHPIGTNFKAVPGVYAFAKDGDDVLTILYVGETSNLKNRLYTNLENHDALPCVRQRGGDMLLTRVVQGERQVRLDLETHLRHTFDPPCNEQ